MLAIARTRLRVADPGLGLALAWACVLGLVAVLVVGAVANTPAGSVGRVGSSAAVTVPLGLEPLAQDVIGASERGFWPTWRGGALMASGGGIDSVFRAGGVQVRASGGVVRLRVLRVGNGGRLTPVTDDVMPASSRDLVSYRRRGLVEWYRNGPFGLEQGFTVAKRPSRAVTGPLTIQLRVSGSLTARRSGAGVVFVSASGVVRVRYGALLAADASGRKLRARVGLSRGALLLRVWDRSARYPLTIDPLIEQGTKLIASCTSNPCAGPDGTGEQGAGALGYSVAVSADGSTALLGAPQDSPGGAAWVFTRTDGVWSQQGTKLIGDCTSSCSGPNGTGETGNPQFGESVAISGDGNTALVGDSGDNTGAGAVWVFTRTDGVWSQQGTKLIGDCTSSCSGPNGTGEISTGNIGASVALSGDGNTALLGATGDAGDVGAFSNDGAAWIFMRSGGVWSQQAKLVGDCTASCTGPNGTGETTLAGTFGRSVALSGDGSTALVGAPFDNSADGAAWVFARTGTNWSQQGGKLVGDCTSACGGPKGTGESGTGELGFSVALSHDGATALLGAPHDGSSAGAAWVFTSVSGVWNQQGTKLVGDCTTACGTANGAGESATGELGYGVALAGDGNTALLGAPYNVPPDQPSENSFTPPQDGAGWVFTRASGAWSQQGTPLVADCSSPCSGPNGRGEVGTGDLGFVVALSGDASTALLGAPADSPQGEGSPPPGSGAAWVFVSPSGLTAVTTDSVSGGTTLGTSWTWNIQIANAGGDATFASGETILTDDLPNASISFGPVTVSGLTNVTNAQDIACAIVSSDLTCTATGGPVTLGAPTGAFDVAFSATPAAAGRFANPRPGGVCAVDPGNVTGSSQTGNTCSDTVTVASPALAVPTNVTSPAITGNATVGSVLTCGTGSWANNPTSYQYRWNRGGAPITGATSAGYQVQALDQGQTLTCTVIAVNATGASQGAISSAVQIPSLPAAGCPRATGTLGGRTLGLITLEMTRARAQRAYTHHATRGKRYEEFFCLRPIGIRVGYASAKLLELLPRRQRAALRGRVVWISTANPQYAVRGIRPGARISAAAKRLKLTARSDIGRNDWYLGSAGAATAILKVRHGIVQEIGIADTQIIHGHKARRVFFSVFA